jgi:type II secretory pathway pseudopilin PulG
VTGVGAQGNVTAHSGRGVTKGETVIVIVLSILVVALGAGAVLLALRASVTTRRLKEAGERLDASQRQLDAGQSQLIAAQRLLASAESTSLALTSQFQQVKEEDNTKESWLNHQQQEIDWLRAELEKRPKVTRKTYKVLTLGMKWTGKTSLTLKWANPLIDLGAIQGTKIERYERTVSSVVLKDITTEHVFEVGDWGGEHIVDAQQELIVDEIHGLLLVVDLGGKDAKVVQPERVQEQLREFQPQSLKYFFGPKTVASCKAVVLFINKSDLLPGTPVEAEVEAMKLYAQLINDLMEYGDRVDIRVLVGSSSYGHSTHLLFSHFVEKILPKNAYDNQLLQLMKSDLAAVTPPGKPTGGKKD